MEDGNTIGDRLRIARVKANLLIPDVSEKTNISTGNLSKLENNINKPSADALISLSNIYNVSIDWILTGKGHEKEADKLIEPYANQPPDNPDEQMPVIRDIKLRIYIQSLIELWTEGNKDKKGWIIVQLERAFPEIVDEVKKEHEQAATADIA